MPTGPPSGPRMVLIDDTTGLPIFGTGSGSGGSGTAGSVNTTISGSTIAIPIDAQSCYRVNGWNTAVVLAGGATYTGVAVDGINFRRITGRVNADQLGTLNIDHSDDAVTWDSVAPISVAVSTPQGFDIPIYARYVRLRYVNGATLQGVFRLSGYLAAI